MKKDINENDDRMNYKLPYEIVAKILAYLPVPDRNNARLACTSWYNASKDVSILKQQMFVYNGTIYDEGSDQTLRIGYEILSNMLENSEYNYINLKFQDTHLNTEFEQFLETYGDRIYSLSFVHCTFSFTAIEKVMLSCFNLKELHFKGDNCISNEIQHISKVAKEDLIQKNLSVLTFTHSKWVSDYIFALFMDVYPYVKELFLDGIRMNYNRRIFQRFYGKIPNDTDATVEYTSDSVVTFLSFYHTIKRKCKCIEKLGFANPVLDGITSEDLFLLASLPCLRLKEVKIHGRSTSPNSLKSFFTHHPNLKAIDIVSLSFDFTSFQFMFSLYPYLERLSIVFGDDEAKWEEMIKLLAKSHVKCFEYMSIFSEIAIENHCDISPNYNLTHLTISSMNNDYRIFTMLLETFRNLTHLNLDMIGIGEGKASVASLIFKNQVNLRTLILNQCHWIDDSVFQGCQLKKLERLELNLLRDLTDVAINNFDFPCLKVLKLDACVKITDGGFAALFRTSPLLQHLSLNETNLSENMLLQMCRSLKFLKQLQIVDCQNLKSLDICSISQFSQSLRFIQSKEEECYFYNYFQKRFIRIEKSKFKLFKFF